ncbi:hypothetical protein HMPREF3036_01090 [Sutterella sp. KLE1602]|nr:hypothetical protein HMPREF3036_01090 [Sutterella sp. KLE1602]
MCVKAAFCLHPDAVRPAVSLKTAGRREAGSRRGASCVSRI